MSVRQFLNIEWSSWQSPSLYYSVDFFTIELYGISRTCGTRSNPSLQHDVPERQRGGICGLFTRALELEAIPPDQRPSQGVPLATPLTNVRCIAEAHTGPEININSG